MSRKEHFENGKDLMRAFCVANKLETPNIIRLKEEGRYYHLGTCAFYRHSKMLRSDMILDKKTLKKLTGTDDQIKKGGNIFIAIKKCAQIGTFGRAWSYPGHWIDRTPYGVLQHELGHYVDDMYSISGHFAYEVVNSHCKNIKPLTGYCPGKKYDHQWCSEWFAEMFRLFVTNPSLLEIIRPDAYYTFKFLGLKPVETRGWAEVLEEAPDRTYELVKRKVG